jgi:cytochrome b subunit of formate dehydrogenase
MSGRKIPRFFIAERVSHWLYAAFFLAAFASGILMWIPATRTWMSGARHTVATYHGVVGLLMVGLPLILLLILDRRRLAADIHEVDAWDNDDRRWFWAALRGGTILKREMPPQGRLNAGQKANSVLVAAMAVGFALTGALLLAGTHVPAWLVSRALWLHGFLAVAAVALFVGHLGHVLLTRHGWAYLNAMVHGSLAEETARERHFKWWAATQEKKDPPQ